MNFQSPGRQQNEMDNRTSARRTKWILAVLGSLAIALAGGGFYIYRCLQPAEASGQTVRVTIPQGTGTRQISAILQEKGLIRNAAVFSCYLKIIGQGSRFQAGVYDMKPGMPLEEIIGKLNRGDVAREEMIRFTIPEGFTLQQIAERLGGLGIVDATTFMEEADHYPGTLSGAAANIPDEPALRHRLEGYLFPETYELKKDSTGVDIISRMLSELDKKLASLPPDWREQLKSRGITFHQMMTVASLVEREVALNEERPIVAGVIYNRLELGMPLQIDATVQYLLDKPKDRLLEKDLEIESPYNTYRHTGLPPGPIASPSLASIRAALYPQKTPYLYYVTKKDGSKGHLFAVTYEEHKRNIAASKAENP